MSHHYSPETPTTSSFMNQHSPFKSSIQLFDERLNIVLKMKGRLDSKINGVSETMYYEEEEVNCFEYEGLQRWLQGKVDKEDEKENNGCE